MAKKTTVIPVSYLGVTNDIPEEYSDIEGHVDLVTLNSEGKILKALDILCKTLETRDNKLQEIRGQLQEAEAHIKHKSQALAKLEYHSEKVSKLLEQKEEARSELFEESERLLKLLAQSEESEKLLDDRDQAYNELYRENEQLQKQLQLSDNAVKEWKERAQEECHLKKEEEERRKVAEQRAAESYEHVKLAKENAETHKQIAHDNQARLAAVTTDYKALHKDFIELSQTTEKLAESDLQRKSVEQRNTQLERDLKAQFKQNVDRAFEGQRPPGSFVQVGIDGGPVLTLHIDYDLEKTHHGPKADQENNGTTQEVSPPFGP